MQFFRRGMINMNDDSSLSSMGPSSAAVAMANDAIDNARRAAASSRLKRAASPSPPKYYVPRAAPASPASHFVNSPPNRIAGSTAKCDGNIGSIGNIGSGRDLDLKHNDNAFGIVAKLITERLLPTMDASPENTRSLTAEDAAFIQKMLPTSARRAFVDALRYRLQLHKMGVVSHDSELVTLIMLCQKMGLERDNFNVLLDLDLPRGDGVGESNPISFEREVPVAATSPNQSNFDDTRNDYDTSYDHRGENVVNFDLHSPTAFSPVEGTFSPTSKNGELTVQSNHGELTAQSLARQQIMAEIKETHLLMNGCVTADAANFWGKHLDDLNQRLVVLTMGEQRNIMESGRAVGGTENTEPFIVTREEFMEHGGNHQNIIDDTKNYVDAMTSISKNKDQDELPICDVVAPSDLPGGYMFEAQLGTTKFLATVPPGGVVRGQRFVSPMRMLETIQISVPLGSWRDSAAECFNNGIFHPLFCNTIFFPCVALGQIMTRTGLDWRGQPANRIVSSYSCANMTVLLSFWIALNVSALVMIRLAWERGYLVTAEYYAPLIIFNASFWLYVACLTAKVRESIRNKYQIPDESCLGSEDYALATFCMPCTICQMGRHTADFDTYRATCCTGTGLPSHVELAPVSFYDDQYETMNDEHQAPFPPRQEMANIQLSSPHP